MEEKNITMTDEQLAQELRKSKGGKLGGKLLSLLGGASVEGLAVRNVKSGETAALDVAGVFAAVGILPQSELVRGQAACTEDGRILTNEFMETDLPGVFAAGDVRATPLRQLVTACADGAVAAPRAREYCAAANG